MSAQIIPAIMCGGAGTRLWPVSRESMPKQFVPLIGERRRSSRCLRAFPFPRCSHGRSSSPTPISASSWPSSCANQRHGSRHRAGAGAPRFRPGRRGRRGARGGARSATRSCSCSPPTMWSASPTSFTRPAGKAREAAARDDRHLRHRAHPVPPRTTATSGLAGKLNGGMPRSPSTHSWRSPTPPPPPAMWRTAISGTAAISCSAPHDAGRDRALRAGDGGGREDGGRRTSTRDLDFLRLAAEPFSRAPKKSIDYAVMERTSLAAVVPADFGWSDVGSWSAVWDMLDHDAAGNAIEGPVVMLDTPQQPGTLGRVRC